MKMRRCVSVLMLALLGTAAHAQHYPTKPIRLLTAEAGGGADFAARLIAQQLSASLRERVVVDNRGIMAVEIAARANADGYTLVLYGSPMWLSPFLRDARYDPVKDFAPITEVLTTPNVLVVHPSLPVRSVQELIAYAKSKPGVLNYSSGSTGSTQHLAAELFKAMAHLDIMRIAFKGSGPALTGVIVGETQLMFPSAGSAAAHIKSGRLRALAVTSTGPSALAPGLPTVAASGIPGYESQSPFGIFAPAKTAAALIKRLNEELVRLLRRAETRDRFFSTGVEAVGSTPEELADTVKNEMAKWGKLIKQAGLRE